MHMELGNSTAQERAFRPGLSLYGLLGHGQGEVGVPGGAHQGC